MCENVSRLVMSSSLWPHDHSPPGFLCPWNSPGIWATREAHPLHPPEKNVYMYITESLNTWNWHNIVNQLYINKNF